MFRMAIFGFKVLLKSGKQLVINIYIFGKHFLYSLSYITLRIQFGMTLSSSFIKPNIPSKNYTIFKIENTFLWCYSFARLNSMCQIGLNALKYLSREEIFELA